MDELTTRLPELTEWARANLPRVGSALLLLLVGYVVARLLRFLSEKLLRRWSIHIVNAFDRVTRRRDGASAAQRAEASSAAASLTSRVIFWVVFALFLAAATSILGMPVVSTWFAGLAAYLPRIVAAVAIVLLGVLAGHIARIASSAAAASAGIRHARAIGHATQTVVVLVAGVVAIEGLGIQVTFLVVLAAVGVGTVLGGIALAFGLGAKTAVANLVSCHYLAKAYRVGHRVRIAGHEGHIVAIGPNAVVLRTADGRVLVPARFFSEEPSVLLTDDEASAP